VKSSRDFIASQLPKSKSEDDLEDEETETTSDNATPSAAPFTFDEKSISGLESVVTEVETWFSEKLAAQEKLNLWEEPVLLLTDLEKKGNQIQSALRKMLLEQQKKQKTSSKKTSKTTSRTESSTTVLAETATASVVLESVETPVYTEVGEEDELEETYTTTATVTATIEESEAEETDTASREGIKHEEL
jgi:5S rRNA maturation endonuclease (ribonuclease M5)